MKSWRTLAAGVAVLVAVGSAATTAGAHVRAHARLGGLDVYWLKNSAQGDLFEIQGGQMALQKTSNTAVKTLAQTLVTDHTKSLDDAKKLAARFHIKLDLSPTPSQQWELQQSSSLTGTAFDQSWSKLEVLDHQQDISDTKSEVQMGVNLQIRKDAIQEIPMLRKHLHLAQQALQSSGGT
jgi:putative membrane protein